PNWPIAAYLSGLTLTALWIERQLQSLHAWYRRLTKSGLISACILGVAMTLLMCRSDFVQPLLGRLAGAPTAERPLPLRRFDPTCRLRGWRFLAQEVDRLRDELHAAGAEPVLAASSWTLPGELGFYCVGHPTVYSLEIGRASCRERVVVEG